jgi:hypothetical protein
LIALQSEGGKSKVKVDTSEIFGLKKLSGYILKNNRHQFFYYTTATIFLRYYNTFRLESNGLPKYIYLSPPLIFPTTYNGIKTKNRPVSITPGAAPIR